ncbi:Erbin (Densin-180-like protein) (Erbb2-interacting protein) (Protein LAP2) [Durusdinium trenchii]|uniref:Erbin (Densin-180-like protein) (Erbb2-interacting protein) (Protein LAP2) n=1 Tax=Durusdinium trenchii TaxID=1381693 RepID=A0ABP0NE48_9DINO
MSGVEYTSTEVEAATEQSPEVVSGSSVACATGSLVIFFVPTNGSLSSQGSLLKSLAGHLALTLGIHAHRIIAIPASNFSRRFDGLPCREFFQKLIQRKRLLDESNESSEWRDEDLAKEVLKEKGTLDSKEPSPLPSDWIFEEDFKHVAALEEDEDEDALEERMEGAMEAEAVEHQRILLVIVPHDSAQGVEDAHRSRNKSSQLRVLCVSQKRHVRVAGGLCDPRKSFLSGVLQSAQQEFPWLQASQLDVAPGLVPSAAAAIALELKAHAPSGEVLLDAEGARLVRRLRQATSVVPPRSGLVDCVLSAGGTGGVGTIWAKHLNARSIIFLGRSPPSAPKVQNLLRLHENSEISYLPVDISQKRQLQQALRNCPSATRIDFAANFCESFQAPRPFISLDATAMDLPKLKLQGAENFVEVLGEISKHRARGKLPKVLFTSTAVSINGAPQLASYTAGARALEAFCSCHSAMHSSTTHSSKMDIRCVALSAWDSIGITEKYPTLADAAPSAGLHLLSPQQGLLALEAAFQFAQPRFNVLMIGLDGGTGNLVASLNTTSVAGCIEIIQAAVQLGLDSMSSMSLHSNLCQASGISLPFSIFYDEPTVLQAASFLHRSAGGGDEEEDLESMLQDAEARRSYHLSQAKQLLASVETSDEEAKAARLKEALDICRKAVEGASGSALVVALALEAEIGTQLGLEELVATTRSLLAACEDAYGADSPDTAVALGKLIRASKAGEGGEAVRWVADFQRRHESFMRAISWVEAAGLATLGGNSQCVGAVSAVSFANVTMTLRTLNLDDQGLGKRVESIIWLSTLGNLEQLEVLKLRRNAICELPSTLGNLLKLRELYLTSNALSDLPQTYSNLSKLQVLCLERNRFERLPRVIYAISRRLLQLGLDEQEICEPSELKNLEENSLENSFFSMELFAPKLSILRGRAASSSSSSFPRLATDTTRSNLNTIFWANNAEGDSPLRLPSFSTTIFESLRLLDLAHNQISSSLCFLEGLRNLRDLSLAGNRLREVPGKISSFCPFLQQLWLHGNDLEELPEELGDLQSLAILELHHNRLKSLPKSLEKLQKLNWLFAHCNELKDLRIIKTLNSLPRLKIVGLGCNQLPLQCLDFQSLQASYGLAWNSGISPEDQVLTEALTTIDLHWDLLLGGKRKETLQELLVVTFSAQGAPVAQGQAEVRALRDSLLPVDALYICDPANAWFLQDPSGNWKGLQYFEEKISDITSRYRKVFAWGGSMGGRSHRAM